MSALAPVPRSSESDSKQRGSPAPAAVCGTNCLKDRDQHYRRSSETQSRSVHKIMRTGNRKAFSISNIGSLMNLRSLMVMLCILSVSCTASGAAENFKKFLKKISPSYKVLNKEQFNARRMETKHGIMQNTSGTKTFWGCLLLIGIMIAVMVFPHQGTWLFTDTGGSLILRLAILIPGTAILGGALLANSKRERMLWEAPNHETYNRNLKHSEDGPIPAFFMTVAMIVTIIVICLVASMNPGDFGKPQTVGSLIVLGLLTMSGGFLSITRFMNQEPLPDTSLPDTPEEAAEPEQMPVAGGGGGATRRLAEILNRL